MSDSNKIDEIKKQFEVDGQATLNRQLPATKTKTPMPTVKSVKKEESETKKKS